MADTATVDRLGIPSASLPVESGGGAAPGARTPNVPVKSRLLCRYSLRGISQSWREESNLLSIGFAIRPGAVPALLPPTVSAPDGI